MTEIKSPTAGSVWKILVKIGDPVSEGDELLILELMKMEIGVEAPHSGTVASIAVDEGAVVAESDLLLTLD